MLIIPAIDISEGKVVRLTRGLMEEKTIYSAIPAAVARQWQEQGARWLHVVDLDGAFAGEPRNWDAVRKILGAVSIPVQFGGGVRSVEQLVDAFGLGVSRVVISSKALSDADFLKSAVEGYRAQIVVSLDAKGGYLTTQGWKEVTSLRATDVIRDLERLHCQRIVFTDISRDGTLAGPNLSSLGEILQTTSMRVVASGGISSLKDIRAVAQLLPPPEAVIIGKALYEGKLFLREVIRVAG